MISLFYSIHSEIQFQKHNFKRLAKRSLLYIGLEQSNYTQYAIDLPKEGPIWLSTRWTHSLFILSPHLWNYRFILESRKEKLSNRQPHSLIWSVSMFFRTHSNEYWIASWSEWIVRMPSFIISMTYRFKTTFDY